ncbi:hypothetical protein CSC2_41050 [Clostridium zeae]|uniref:DUF1284 domain-containing protein n=1 Tax=Clostridium zeae TaxID=2759022 RepID=A0ABQ1EFR4_9CLOT|nr:DUF1284 domain-containing protein [Clostridium zeae]GFZ33579.1 hypothetical protein CSC2_41050 [Clostridium zeae]
MIYLRPHHGLCIHHFIGKGYSDDFIYNMKNIINILEDNSNPKIMLVSGGDEICSFCPNNRNGSCLSGQKPDYYDIVCLELCDLNFGDTLYWQDFKKRIQTSILEPKKLNQVCINCEWLYICENLHNESVIFPKE